jgi:outer membrane protein W
LSSVPLTGAVEYSLGKKDFKPFIGIGIGMYNISKGDDVKFVSINKFGYNSHFGITPILGFDYVLTDKLSVIGNAKYIFIPGNSASRLQLNAGVGFHF